MSIIQERKAGLEEHALEVVLALVCIVLLAVGLVRLYSITKESEYEQASATLKRVEQKLFALNAGEFTRFPLEGPCTKQKECTWWIRGWSANEKGRPEKCYFKSCICMCRGEKGKLASASDCQGSQTGVCLAVDAEKVSVGSEAFVLYKPFADKEGGIPAARPGSEREQCMGIKIASVLREIELRKEEGRVTVSSVSSEPLQEKECREGA